MLSELCVIFRALVVLMCTLLPCQTCFSQQKVYQSSLEIFPGIKPDCFAYRTFSPNSPISVGGYAYFLALPEASERRPLLEPAALIASLSEEVGKQLKRENLQFRVLKNTIRTDGYFEFSFEGQRWHWDPEKKAASATGVRNFSECFALGTRSSSGGEAAALTLNNELKQTIEIYWLDLRGRSTKYGTLPPGQTFKQSTYVDHLWSCRDQDGNELCRFRTPIGALESTLTPELLEAFASYRKANRDKARRATRPSRSRSIAGDYRLVNHDISGLTTDGTKEQPYRGPLLISPNGKYLAARRVSVATKRQVSIVESSPTDRIQPKLLQFDYVKPGDDLDEQQVVIFELETKKRIEATAEQVSQFLPNAFSISRLQWSETTGELLFLYNQRGHQKLRLLGFDPVKGTLRSIIEESSETFIDYAHKTNLQFIRGGEEVLWMSERSGFNHLYRFDLKSGQLLNAVTQGDWVLRSIDEIDEEAGRVFFYASGIDERQSPYHRHYCSISLDGSDLRVLTDGDGDHQITKLRGFECFIDKYSRVDLPPVHELRSLESGKKLVELARADCTPLVESGWTLPQRFVAKGRDGATDIHGVIVFPTGFDPDSDQMYPIVERVYAGPHDSHAPVRFSTLRQLHQFADMGFIMVQVDGMGTSNRGKVFHDHCWKNIADAGFPDRIAWIKAAAKEIPQMDIERVGIFGGSAGGQNAVRALIDHHSFYDVAVADCGCHDNRMDKIWWNEAWMGWPVDESYKASSNVEHASRLQGELLLIVGELDRNVDPASTMQLVDALIKADKDFDMLVIPGAGHGAAETRYGQRRRAKFLREHLLKESGKTQ